MNFFTVALSALMGMLLVTAAPAHNGLETILGHNNVTYTVVDMVFDLKINETLTIPVTGTIQDGFKELAKRDPGQAATIKAAIDAHSGAGKTPASVLASTAQADECCTRDNYYCDIYTDADCDDINDGISYLKTVTGTPVNGPGPGTCNRVSCSYDSGIYWCNDNAAEYVLDNFTLIANGAEQIMYDCTFMQTNVCNDGFNGQQFYSGGWNVIVKGTSC